MTSYDKLLLENKAWAKEMKKADPEFFSRLEHIQTPEFLWIGCSDSRVPANQITNTYPGEIFVHRNIANLVVNTDVNMLSVLHYAVDVLKVKHVIVCGHYGCGGIKAALTTNDYKQVLNMWLRNIKDVYRIHRDELEQLPEGDPRLNKLVELTVQEQVINLSKTSIVQKAWAEENRPHLHGWVYNLADGLINPVFDMVAGSKVDPAFAYSNFH
ncbi:carbonic anhydrase [Segetibacter sp. 3557_3]|uniref:carbonic anhydrase n=1 Tax=Segetibacter sp. 3557_3 TaxID=2547429 RepID=UPI0010588DAC|nr:carbonic anhydrase [Segetibacter sp. 3557_3]TDH25175.1 carbonic anhydrase [Segetibacter sp. 3557_3]